VGCVGLPQSSESWMLKQPVPLETHTTSLTKLTTYSLVQLSLPSWAISQLMFRLYDLWETINQVHWIMMECYKQVKWFIPVVLLFRGELKLIYPDLVIDKCWIIPQRTREKISKEWGSPQVQLPCADEVREIHSIPLCFYSHSQLVLIGLAFKVLCLLCPTGMLCYISRRWRKCSITEVYLCWN